MSSRIDVNLRPSLIAGLIAAAPWLLVLAVCLLLAATGFTLVLILAPVALYGAGKQILCCGYLSRPLSVRRLLVRDQGLQAELADGRTLAVTAAADSRLWGPLVVLKLGVAGTINGTDVVLVADPGPSRLPRGNTSARQLRQLRAWLRLATSPGPVHRA